MSVSGTDVIWEQFTGLVGKGAFGFGSQPLPGGDAGFSTVASNVVQAPNDFFAWGSFKGTGILGTSHLRINWADKTGDGSLPSDADFAPNPGSVITDAKLILRASSNTASDQLSLFDTQVSMLEFDPNGRWEIETHTGSSFMHGLQGFGFRVTRQDSTNIDGVGNTPATGSVRVQMGRTDILGANRIGFSFQVGPGGENVATVFVTLGKVGVFVPAEGLQVSVYPCVEVDGSNDAPDPTLGAVGASSVKLLMSSIPTGGGTSELALNWPLLSPLVLTEGRYVAMVEKVDWVGTGDKYVNVELSPASRSGDAGSQNSHACAVSTPEVGLPTSFVGPGFATGTGYVSGYDFPHTHDSAGGLLAGTVRDAAPNSPTTVWPTPRAGPLAVATPAFVTPGVEYEMDVTALIQGYIDRPEYASEVLSPHPIGFALAADTVDEDTEREGDLFRLKITWEPAPVCAEADQVVVAGALASGLASARAAAGQVVTGRAAVTGRKTTTQRALAGQVVAARGAATMAICPKD